MSEADEEGDDLEKTYRIYVDPLRGICLSEYKCKKCGRKWKWS